MLKYLRIAVTALSLAACVLLALLWVRSYWWTDFLFRPISNTQLVTLQSHCGKVAAYLEPIPPPKYSWKFYSHPSDEFEGLLGHAKWGFAFDQLSDYWLVVAPHWLFVLLTAVLSISPWIRVSMRFSLRTLLIATTLVAVVMGIIVVAR